MGVYGLASFDVVSGDVRPWPQTNLGPGSNARAQASQGARVYSGGGFTTVGGQPRRRLAAFEALSGSLTDWNPGADNYVWALAAADGSVYAGGHFTAIAGEQHSFLAAIDDPDQLLAAPIGSPGGPGPSELHSVYPNPLSSSSVAW